MTLHTPRLLPLTIAGMAALLMVKCAGLVLAAAPAAEPTQAVVASTSAPALVQPPAVMPAKPNGAPAAPPDGEQNVLSVLRRRRDELDAREAAMQARESVLDATARKLDQRVAELKALQAQLEQLDAARLQKDDADWLGLVTLYEKMKPRDAARIFDELEMPVLVRLVDRMKEAKAAAILAAMLPDKAREATTELAALRERRGAVTTAAAK
jgi:flagellar motility protein MotE (MotC chaperone)